MLRIDDLHDSLAQSAKAVATRTSSDPHIINNSLRVTGEEAGLSESISAINAALPDSTLVDCNKQLQSLLSALTTTNPSSEHISNEFRSFLQATPSAHIPTHCNLDCDGINALLKDFRAASFAGQDDACADIMKSIAADLPILLERHGGKLVLSISDGKGCKTLLASPNQSTQLRLQTSPNGDAELVVRNPFSQDVNKIKHFTRGRLHGAKRADDQIVSVLDKLGTQLQQCSTAMAGIYESQAGKPTETPEDGIGRVVADGTPLLLDNLRDPNKRDGVLSTLASSTEIKSDPDNPTLVKVHNKWIPAQLWINQHAKVDLTKRDTAIRALESMELPSETGVLRDEQLLESLDPTKQKLALQKDLEYQGRIADSRHQVTDSVSRRQIRQTCESILRDLLANGVRSI